MASEEDFNQALAQQVLGEQIFAAGVASFESGNYQAAVEKLEQAKDLASPGTYQSGEIQVWLCNAYDAVGRTEEAIALCRKLVKHPELDIRKLARYVLGILTAPELRKLEGVTTDGPNFENLDSNYRYQGGYGNSGAKNFAAQNQKPDPLNLNGPKLSAKMDRRYLLIAGAIAVLGLFAWLTR
jgi:tetratricopeptide (TPR) repeat protein